MKLKKTSPDWHNRAACRGLTPQQADELFFPVRQIEEKLGTDGARQYCDICPALYHCLRDALINNEPGIWGGMTRAERDTLKTKVKPEQYATVEQLQDLVELEYPKCSDCGKNRRNKDDSGKCAECFHVSRKRETAAA